MVGGPFGSKLVSRDYVADGVPVIRGGNLPSNARFSFDEFVFVTEEKVSTDLFGNIAFPGDIVVTQRGTLGQVGLIPADSSYARFVVSQSQMKLTVDRSKADPAFVYYALRSPIGQHEIKSRAITAGVPHINLSLFQQLQLPIPPLPTQRKIAAILSAYDDLIENNNRRIKLLEEMAQRIYREWFVDFRYPGHENVPLVDSELGPIPLDWEVANIGAVAENFDRQRKPLPGMVRALRPGPYPYYGAAKIFDFIDDFIFDGTYLLMAEDGSVTTPEGKAVLQYVTGKFWANNHTHVLCGTRLSTEHLYLLLADVPITGYITGAAQPKITQANMNRIPCVVPPQQITAAFDDTAISIFRALTTMASQISALRATRNLLLPRLISGEVDVADFHIAMPGAAA